MKNTIVLALVAALVCAGGTGRVFGGESGQSATSSDGLRSAFAAVAGGSDGQSAAARVSATYQARCDLLLPGGLKAVKPYTGVVAGLSLRFTDPSDRMAFGIAAATKNGAQIFGLSERKGTHARELIVQPPPHLAASAAEVWDPRQGTWERPFVDAEGNLRLVFAPHATLFLVWPAQPTACAPQLVSPVGPEVPVRTAVVTTQEADGGKRTTRTELRFSFGEVKPAGRFVLLFDGLKPGAVCAVEVNGQFAGGCIGAPCQLDVTRWLRAGANLIRLSSDVVKQPRLVRLAPAEGPYDLRCEYQTEPIGVVQPRFFWKYAGKRPAKWRLDIASHPDFGASSRVYSGETTEHLYVEPKLALRPFTRHWWRVSAGSRTAVGSFVSGIDTWTKPFFKRSWKWEPAEYWRARKQVELHGAKRVVLAVTSRGCHKLYVNGRAASEGFGPNRSHIEDGILLAETYDVTSLVKEGLNEFELLLGDGWARFKTCNKESCVSIDGRAETAAGTVVIDSSTPWLVSRTGLGTVGPWGWNFGGEHLTDVRQVEGECAGTPVAEKFTISCDVSDRDAVAKEIRPVSIEPTAEKDEWRIDMGEEFTGFVRLRLKGQKGQMAQMTVSDQAALKCAFNQRYEYVFAGGDGVFENRLNWMAGRYLYLSGCARPTVTDVTGLSIGCVLRRTGDFTGDADLARVLSLDADTFIATTLSGVTMDCPHRERLGYGEASLSSMWGDGLPYFDSAAYYYAYLLKWASSQEPDGHIPHVSPDYRGGGGTFWSNFPIYALSDFWRLYPDQRLRSVIRPVADKWLDYLDAHTHNGILEKYETGRFGCLGDWAFPDGVIRDWGESRAARFFNCCAYAWAIRQALALDGLVPSPARRQTLEARLRVVQQAIDREYYRDGLYYSEDARYQVMGLVSGAAEAAGHVAETERAMLDIVEWKGYVDGGSPSFTTLLRVLCTTARGRELALRALRRHQFPGYLYFADEGYNTLPEYWNYGRNSMGSMIHTCFTGAAGTLMYGLAGFDVKGNEITVAPFLSPALPNFAAHLETLYGTLSIKVESVRGRKIVWVTCPAGCHGTFVGRTRQPLVEGRNRFECD